MCNSATVCISYAQVSVNPTSHVMARMGTDFTYKGAHTWFVNLDRLIKHINERVRVAFARPLSRSLSCPFFCLFQLLSDAHRSPFHFSVHRFIDR